MTRMHCLLLTALTLVGCGVPDSGQSSSIPPMASLVQGVQPVAVGTAPRSRALVIGVGSFSDSDIPALPGIDIDVQMMKSVLANLGVGADDIRILENQKATLAGVKQSFDSFLVDGTRPGDRVVLYFSGHGSSMADESGDEADGADEFLVMHDTSKAGNVINNVLLDDDLGVMLSQLSDREVLVIIDACHSGTATKGMPLTKSIFPTSNALVPKLWTHDRLVAAPSRDRTLLDAPAAAPISSNGPPVGYVALMAAQDDQTADATADGSVFTRGLNEAVSNARAAHRPLTAADIRDQIATFAKDAGSSSRPNALSEPATLVSKRIIVESPTGQAATAAGPTWSNLDALVQGSSNEIGLVASAASYRPGEMLNLRVTVPADGYLYVLAVSKADDAAAVLYPSCCSGDNRYRAGDVARIPDVDRWERAWELFTKPSEGAGENLIVAIVSEVPLSLRGSGIGDSKDLVVGLSPKGLKSLQDAFSTKGLSKYPMAGKVEVVVQ